MKKFINQIHDMGLLVSHHFNPRIADAKWVEKNPKFTEAFVINPSDNPWIEFYKNNICYVMNPNSDIWLQKCLEVIRYFKKIGIDFVELDQIAYQRNLYTSEGGFGPGYQKLIDLTHREGVKFWVEGVSDVFNLPEDCYFQVLPRNKVRLWETNENRRGYPYGVPFTLFYRTLKPNAAISFQIVTEKMKAELIPKRLALANKLDAQIYDLELGFVDKTYKDRLAKTLRALSKFLKDHK